MKCAKTSRAALWILCIAPLFGGCKNSLIESEDLRLENPRIPSRPPVSDSPSPTVRPSTPTPVPSPSPAAGARYPASVLMTKLPYTPARFVPGYLEAFRDPVFGFQVTRIADAAIFKTGSVQHHYSKDQPWNRDGTLIKMSGKLTAILEGDSYKLLRVQRTLGQSLWSNVRADLLYGTDGIFFSKMNVRTGEVTHLRSFAEFDQYWIGLYEGNLSNDDRYAPIVGRKGDDYTFQVYDLVNNRINGSLAVGAHEPDWFTISQSGKYALISWKDEGAGPYQGIKIYDIQMRNERHLSDGTPHGDTCYDSDMKEVFVGFYGSAQSGPWMYQLDNLQKTIVMPQRLAGGHVSCRNLDRPGWAYFSSVGHASGPEKHVGYREIFAVRLDGSGLAQRFVHHRSINEGNYNAESHAVPNWNGTRVMFKSNWDGLIPDEMPPSWVVEVPQK